jgi:hypothetical protein
MNIRAMHITGAALILSIAAGLATARDDDSERGEGRDGLVGTWQMRITPYVCGSDPIVSLPQAAIDSYLTFGPGGTLLEIPSNPRFMPGQRSPGHGHWERIGRRTYNAVFQAFIQFSTQPATPTSYQRGTQRVEQEIELVPGDRWNDTESRWTSTAIVTFRDLDGNRVPPSGCATAEAVRMP